MCFLRRLSIIKKKIEIIFLLWIIYSVNYLKRKIEMNCGQQSNHSTQSIMSQSAVAQSAQNARQNMEVGLKTEIKRQSGLKNWEHQKCDHTTDCLVEMWKEYQDCYNMLSSSLAGARRWESTLEDKIWAFMESGPATWSKKVNSSHFGLKTILKDYTNGKGQTKPAHFTQRGYYFGSTKQLGDQPVFYEGNFEINKKNFKIIFQRLCDLEKDKIGRDPTTGKVIKGHYNLSLIFFPRDDLFVAPEEPEVASSEESDDDEKPLALPPKKKITLKKKE